MACDLASVIAPLACDEVLARDAGDWPDAGDRQLGRQLAVHAGLAHQVQQAAIQIVDRSDIGEAQRGLEADGAVVLGLGRRQADLALGAGGTVGSAEAVGSVQGWRGQLAFQPLETGALGAVDAVHRQHAILDPERGQRDVGRQVGRVAQHLAEGLPVPAALVVERQAQHRPLELDLVGLDGAPEQRGHRELHGEAVGPEKRLLEVDGGVGNAHLLETEVGRRQQVQIDGAADAHLAAEQARGLLLEHAAVAVPVDEIGHREQRADHGDQEDCQGDEEIAHRAPPSVPAHGSAACAYRGIARGRASVLPQEPMNVPSSTEGLGLAWPRFWGCRSPERIMTQLHAVLDPEFGELKSRSALWAGYRLRLPPR